MRTGSRRASASVLILFWFAASFAGGCSGGPFQPGPCGNSGLLRSVDAWPGWSGDGGAVLYLHRPRHAEDSTYIAWVDTLGTWAPMVRVPEGGREHAYHPDGRSVMYGLGLELYRTDLMTGSTDRLTNGGRGAHWPRWDPQGVRIAYSRVLRHAFDPDSTAGLRILNPLTGADRPLLRTGSRPWKARGPAAWSPSGNEIAFVDADTSFGGRTRFVIVDVESGSWKEIGWVDGVPGGIEWSRDGTGWIYDSTPRACPNDESERRTWMMTNDGRTFMSAVQLGDASVFNGYPFVLSSDGRLSAHVGNVGGVGVIVVTDVRTGRTRSLTSP